MRALAKPISVACRIAFLLAATGAGQAQAGLFSDEEARRALADFKAKTEAQFDNQAKGQVELANQIQRQNEEMARLRGLIETLTYELETAKKRQQDFYIDLDTRLRKQEELATAASTAAAAEKPAEPAKPASDPAAESRDYQASLDLFKANKFAEAASGFAAFVQKYPEGALAPNAQFWLGNAWVAQHDCRKAIEAHTVVTTKWPESTKAPDAILAIANCQQEMGNANGAKRSLENLVAKYPTAPAADTARQRLKKR